MSSYRSRGLVAVGVVMASLAAFVIAYAAQVSTPETNSGGQGVTVTEGYTAGTVSYSGDWAATTSNNTSTNVTTASFSLEQTNGALVTSAETTVYAQLTGGTSSNWTLCTIPTAGNVTCDFSSASKPMSSITGIDIVAQGDALPAVNPPDEPEPEAAVFVASDGSLDPSFNPGTVISSGSVDSVLVQPDGKIFVGGQYVGARLNSNGNQDNSFNTGTGFQGNGGYKFLLLDDGKMLVAGDFYQYDGQFRAGIIRVNADGSLDTSFDTGTGLKSGLKFCIDIDCWEQSSISVGMLALQPDGKILIGGEINNFNGVSSVSLVRINSDATVDTSFNPGLGATRLWFGLNAPSLSSGAIQPDEKIVIGGLFTSYDGVTRNRIARVNADGSLDTSFDPGTGASGTVTSIAIQPDGKILIGGLFTSYDGVTRNRIARLNADGSLDTSFDPVAGVNSTVNSIVLQPDGKILIGGSFTSYNGTARGGIARLNADGSLDTSFDNGTGANSSVNSIFLQPDGKILIGGTFTTYDGVTRNRIARLGLASSPPTEPALGESFEVATLDAGDGTGFSGGVSTSGAELFVLTNSSPSKVIRFDQPALTNKGTLSLE